MTTQSKITVIYIGGWLVPKGRQPYGNEVKCPDNINVISVYPSGACSIHDRVMQTFYEIKGGQVHFGKNHSQFHGHNETGKNFELGKYTEWDENHPVHLIGHSYGGVTARALHQYLADGLIEGAYKGATSSSWVVSVTFVNSPLNGCIRVYTYGAHLSVPSIVRWGSVGFFVGWCAHLFEFLDLDILRNFYDFQLEHWKLSCKEPGAATKFFQACLGCCLHTSTDNSAYDMTLHSQRNWASLLQIQPQTFYLSIVGTTAATAPFGLKFTYNFPNYLFRSNPLVINGEDVSKWAQNGFDGLLSTKTQEYPFLKPLKSRILSSVESNNKFGTHDITSLQNISVLSEYSPSELSFKQGRYHVKYFPMHHLDKPPSEERNSSWKFIFESIELFNTLWHKNAISSNFISSNSLQNCVKGVQSSGSDAKIHVNDCALNAKCRRRSIKSMNRSRSRRNSKTKSSVLVSLSHDTSSRQYAPDQQLPGLLSEGFMGQFNRFEHTCQLNTGPTYEVFQLVPSFCLLLIRLNYFTTNTTNFSACALWFLTVLYAICILALKSQYLRAQFIQYHGVMQGRIESIFAAFRLSALIIEGAYVQDPYRTVEITSKICNQAIVIHSANYLLQSIALLAFSGASPDHSITSFHVLLLGLLLLFQPDSLFMTVSIEPMLNSFSNYSIFTFLTLLDVHVLIAQFWQHLTDKYFTEKQFVQITVDKFEDTAAWYTTGTVYTFSVFWLIRQAAVIIPTSLSDVHAVNTTYIALLLILILNLCLIKWRHMSECLQLIYLHRKYSHCK